MTSEIKNGNWWELFPWGRPPAPFVGFFCWLNRNFLAVSIGPGSQNKCIRPPPPPLRKEFPWNPMVWIRWKRLLWKSFTITEESRSSAPPRLPHPRTTMLPRGRVGWPSLKWNLCSQFELRRSPRSESRLFSRSSLFCRWTHSSPATPCKTLLVWSWRELQFLKLWILDWSKMNTMYSLFGRLTWACCVTNLCYVTGDKKQEACQMTNCKLPKYMQRRQRGARWQWSGYESSRRDSCLFIPTLSSFFFIIAALIIGILLPAFCHQNLKLLIIIMHLTFLLSFYLKLSPQFLLARYVEVLSVTFF